MVTRAARDRSAGAVAERAARIRVVLTDCDGVLTDAGIYYSPSGEELRRFSVRDGMGFERLREIAGIPACIITREDSPIVARRADKLRIDVILGAKDKLTVAWEWAATRGYPLTEVAYLGDDVNDLDLLRAVGLSACPADAERPVRDEVDVVGTAVGGHGAFREFAEFILAARAATLTRSSTQEIRHGLPASAS